MEIPVVLQNLVIFKGSFGNGAIPLSVLGFVNKRGDEDVSSVQHRYVLKGKCVLEITGWVCECKEVFRKEDDVNKHCERHTIPEIEKGLNDNHDTFSIDCTETHEPAANQVKVKRRRINEKRGLTMEQKKIAIMASEKSDFFYLDEPLCRRLGVSMSKVKFFLVDYKRSQKRIEVTDKDRQSFEALWTELKTEDSVASEERKGFNKTLLRPSIRKVTALTRKNRYYLAVTAKNHDMMERFDEWIKFLEIDGKQARRFLNTRKFMDQKGIVIGRTLTDQFQNEVKDAWCKFLQENPERAGSSKTTTTPTVMDRESMINAVGKSRNGEQNNSQNNVPSRSSEILSLLTRL